MTEVRIDFKVDRLGGYEKGELSNVNGPGARGGWSSTLRYFLALQDSQQWLDPADRGGILGPGPLN